MTCRVSHKARNPRKKNSPEVAQKGFGEFPKPAFELLLGYFIFSGISGLVAHAARHKSMPSLLDGMLSDVECLVWSQKQGGSGSVPLRFAHGTVRAVPVFSSNGSSGVRAICAFQQRNGTVPVSVPEKRFRFRFPEKRF